MLAVEDDELLKEEIDPKIDLDSIEFNSKEYLAVKHRVRYLNSLIAYTRLTLEAIGNKIFDIDD